VQQDDAYLCSDRIEAAMSVANKSACGSSGGEGQQQVLCCSPAPGSAGSKSACSWSVQQEKSLRGCSADGLYSNDGDDFLIGTQVADGGSVECYQLFEDGMVRISVLRTCTRAALSSSLRLLPKTQLRRIIHAPLRA
jgi:hypothetical protein